MHFLELDVKPRFELNPYWMLVQKLRLPTNGPDGAPLSYKFHHKNSGRQIQDAQTLAEAQVKEGDILRLQPEITAG